jgi:hypothetical protein
MELLMANNRTLVERLRNPELSDTDKAKNWDTMDEAADEIERLQGLVNHAAGFDSRFAGAADDSTVFAPSH